MTFFNIKVIIFDFHLLDIEPEHGDHNSSCPHDYLQIYDGPTEDVLHRTYCSSIDSGWCFFQLLIICIANIRPS